MGAWLAVVARVLVGVLIMKTGADLVQGGFMFSGFTESQPVISGIFIILIGIHIVFSSIFK